ncbi:MAG: sigma-54-dependent transcriptional regulator [Terriglobales bacterium]
MSARILIVDDEKLLRWALARKCGEWGYETTQAENCAQTLEQFRTSAPDLVLLDIRLPDGNGVELLRELRGMAANCAFILITADPQLDDVKTALRLGAYDYLSKPVNFDELQITVANALVTTQLRDEVATLRDQVRRARPPAQIVGHSEVMRKLMDFVHRVASSPATAVLLQGESGTGKDLIAQILHQESSRAGGPYVTVNCSAIPETLMEAELFGHEKGAFTDAKALKKGLFEVASGGALFLDEIGEMPLPLQSKLLRALEDQRVRRIGGLRDISVDVRIVAASNRNLEDEVNGRRFRQDLFYRLSVVPIFIPPLRHRKEDIPALASFFIEHFNRRFSRHVQGLSPEAERQMMDYAWPGNVRELKNAIQRALILEDGPHIRPAALPFAAEGGLFASSAAFPDQQDTPDNGWREMGNGRRVPLLTIPAAGTSLAEIEKLLIAEALRTSNGNQSQAARLLDISRDALRYSMKKFDLP